jgi:integrase
MEILTLCCNQLDFKNRQIILDNNIHVTKSKKVRSIPMNETVYNILFRRNQVQESIFVFTYHNEPIKPDFISKKFKKIVRKAGLDDRLKFHSLRHTFASWLVQASVSIYQVSKLLGHADIKTTQIYSHLKPEDLTNAVYKLEVSK